MPKILTRLEREYVEDFEAEVSSSIFEYLGAIPYEKLRQHWKDAKLIDWLQKLVPEKGAQDEDEDEDEDEYEDEDEDEAF